MTPNDIAVKVVMRLGRHYYEFNLNLAMGSTALQAIRLSGIPELSIYRTTFSNQSPMVSIWGG